MYRRDGVMVKAPKRKATKTKSLCFPSKNVCHSNLEPAAQLYSHNCTYIFLNIGHKIVAHVAGECAHGKEKLEGTLTIGLPWSNIVPLQWLTL